MSIKDSERLIYLEGCKDDEIEELWNNCFGNSEKRDHINKFEPFPIIHKSQIRSFLRRRINYSSCVIKRKNENEIIGFLIFGNFFPGQNDSIGFNIGLNYINNGYATEAVISLLNYLTEETNVNECYAFCYETNSASINVMHKCGFENLGRTEKKYGNNFEIKLKKSLI